MKHKWARTVGEVVRRPFAIRHGRTLLFEEALDRVGTDEPAKFDAVFGGFGRLLTAGTPSLLRSQPLADDLVFVDKGGLREQADGDVAPRR